MLAATASAFFNAASRFSRADARVALGSISKIAASSGGSSCVANSMLIITCVASESHRSVAASFLGLCSSCTIIFISSTAFDQKLPSLHGCAIFQTACFPALRANQLRSLGSEGFRGHVLSIEDLCANSVLGSRYASTMKATQQEFPQSASRRESVKR